MEVRASVLYSNLVLKFVQTSATIAISREEINRYLIQNHRSRY